MCRTGLCGSPRLSASFPSPPESLACVEISLEIPSTSSPAKSESLPRLSMSSRESLELREQSMRSLREALAGELLAGISEIARQCWRAHDTLTAEIRANVGSIVGTMAGTYRRKRREFYSRFVVVNKLGGSDLSGEVAGKERMTTRRVTCLMNMAGCLPPFAVVVPSSSSKMKNKMKIRTHFRVGGKSSLHPFLRPHRRPVFPRARDTFSPAGIALAV